MDRTSSLAGPSGSTRPHGQKKITLFGNFGTLNIGNECTLKAIIHNIRRLLPGADINCVCSVPDDVRTRHGVPAFPISRDSSRTPAHAPDAGPVRYISRILRGIFLRLPQELKETARIRQVLKGRDMLVMTGTGMLGEDTGTSLGFPFEILKWTAVAKWCRLKVLFVSVGVEPVHRARTRWLVTSSLYLADYVGFRDRHSQQLMTELGFHRGSFVFPDLAFSLPEAASPPAHRVETDRPVVGVGLFDYCERGQSGPDARLAYHDYLDKVGEFIKWLVERGYPVRILIGDITYDDPVREDLRTRLEGKGISYAENRIIDEPIASIPDLFRQIASTDIVVATRFHNVIISLLLARPVISISYNIKNDVLLAEMGLPEFCMGIADFDVPGLIARFTGAEKRMWEIPLQIRERTREYQRVLEEQYRRILSIG